MKVSGFFMEKRVRISKTDLIDWIIIIVIAGIHALAYLEGKGLIKWVQ